MTSLVQQHIFVQSAGQLLEEIQQYVSTIKQRDRAKNIHSWSLYGQTAFKQAIQEKRSVEYFVQLYCDNGNSNALLASKHPLQQLQRLRDSLKYIVNQPNY